MRKILGPALAATIFAGGLIAAGPAAADEPLFGYVYTTDLLPKGKWEVEQWITDREGQAYGRFHHIDFRTEAEYGLQDNFQVSAYLNYSYADAAFNSVRHLTEGIEIPYDHNPNTPFSRARFDGVSLEAIYRVMSPYIDPFGLAFYIEPEIGSRESGVEFRTIVQKNFLEDRLVFAGNFWVEFERESGSNLVPPGSTVVPSGGKDSATYAEFDLGVSYRFISNWSVGLEFRNHNEFDGWTLNPAHQDHAAFFLGPDIHWAGQRWFATLALLHQLPVADTYTSEQTAELHNGYLYGDEHTTWDGIRLKVGYTF